MSTIRGGRGLLDSFSLDDESARIIASLAGGLNFVPIGILLCARAVVTSSVWLGIGLGIPLVALGGYLGFVAWTSLRVEDKDTPRSFPPRTNGKPWTYRRTWRPDVMVSPVADVSVVKVAGGIITSVVGWSIVLAEWSNGSFSGADVILLVVPAMANLGMFLVIRERARDIRFGQTRLRLETKPAVMGRRATAVFETSLRPETFEAESFTVRCRCYRRYITTRRNSDGDTRRVVAYDVKWSDDKTVRPRVGRDGTLEIPVSFQLPTDYPEATPRQKDDRIGWELAATADVPGIDYKAAFEIPVFSAATVGLEDVPENTPEETPAQDRSSSNQVLWTVSNEDANFVPAKETEETSADPYANYEIVPHFDEPVSEGVSMEQTSAGGLRFDFAARRSWMPVFLWGLSIVLTTPLAGVALWSGIWGEVGPMGSLEALSIGLFVSPFVIASVYGLGCALTGSSSLVVDKGRIQLVTRTFGREKTQTIPAPQLADARPTAEGKVGRTIYYSIYLYLANPMDLPELRRSRTASESTAQLMQALRLTGDDPAVYDKIKSHIEEVSSRLRVADLIADKDEAEWMCAQIIAAAKREARFA